MLHSLWENRFGHQVDDDRLFLLSVERVLQMDDFAEVCSVYSPSRMLYLIRHLYFISIYFQDGIWVTSEEYKSANPDPLRDFAERMIDEINTNNREDILRFCNIYLDLDFQVSNEPNIMIFSYSQYSFKFSFLFCFFSIISLGEKKNLLQGG